MRVAYPLTVTVDANMLVKSFSRYLFLRLHESGICVVVYSNLIWNETMRNLLRIVPGMTKAKIAKIHGHMEDAGVLEYVLDTDEHQSNISLLVRTNREDRHVLYLAYISESRFLVTENLKDFRPGTVRHRHHRRLGFYSEVVAVSFDSFVCMLIREEERLQGNCDGFLAVISETMAHMWSHSVKEIFDRLYEDNLCPGACDLLMPHFEAIERLVERERRSLRQQGGSG